MKLKNIIEKTISGDWGNELYSIETPCAIGCVRGADIVPIENNAFDTIPNRYVSEKSLKLHSLEVGDIIIEKSGGSPTQSTGRVSYISEALVKNKIDVLCSNFCCAIRIKKEWNSKFVYYFWKYVYNAGIFFNFEGKTSGLKNLQLDNALSSIEIPYCPKPVQDSIVGTLSRIESKIALNREINRNLEAMARQLYDYWFVQFDFPDENGKPYKSSGGKMVWNKKLKREIPEGWSDGKLIDIANITMGQSPDGSSYNESGDGVLFYQGSTDFGLRFPSVRQYTTAPTRFAKQGDILMSVRAPVGTTNIANADCCIGRGLSAMNSKIGSISHLYHIIQDLKIAFDMRNDAGTTFGSITKDDLYGLVVLKPDASIISKYEVLCSPVFDRQMLIGKEIDVLVKQRDELMPLLMNGQVSIMPKEVNCDLSELGR